MYNGKTILAIVLARGGSKGLPRKNIKYMNGKPLIGWTLKRIKESQFIDDVCISTDDEEIAGVCEACGFPISELRPARLAKDETTSYEVIGYIFDCYGKEKEFDYFILLEPTSPLRKKDDIDNIIKMGIDRAEADGVISVGEVHTEHPSLLKRIDSNDYVQKLYESEKIFPRRQQHKTVYFPYGVGYLMKRDIFLKKRTLYTNHMIPYIIERWQNYEIDDIYDFICIEAIMMKRGMDDE